MDGNAIWEFLQQIVSVDQAITLVALILGNLLLGCAAAIKNGEFEIARFKDFIYRAGYIFIAYVGLSAVAVVLIEWVPFRELVFAALTAFLSTQIIDNLKGLGLPLPDKVSNLLERKK